MFKIRAISSVGVNYHRFMKLKWSRSQLSWKRTWVEMSVSAGTSFSWGLQLSVQWWAWQYSCVVLIDWKFMPSQKGNYLNLLWDSYVKYLVILLSSFLPFLCINLPILMLLAVPCHFTNSQQIFGHLQEGSQQYFWPEAPEAQTVAGGHKGIEDWFYPEHDTTEPSESGWCLKSCEIQLGIQLVIP